MKKQTNGFGLSHGELDAFLRSVNTDNEWNYQRFYELLAIRRTVLALGTSRLGSLAELSTGEYLLQQFDRREYKFDYPGLYPLVTAYSHTLRFRPIEHVYTTPDLGLWPLQMLRKLWPVFERGEMPGNILQTLMTGQRYIIRAWRAGNIGVGLSVTLNNPGIDEEDTKKVYRLQQQDEGILSSVIEGMEQYSDFEPFLTVTLQTSEGAFVGETLPLGESLYESFSVSLDNC